MLKKLRIKFIVVNMSIVLAMLVIIFGMVYHFTRRNMEEQSINLLHTVAQNPGKPVEGGANARLPYFTLQINIWGKIVVSGSSYFDLENEAFIQELIREVYNREENSGIIESHALLYYTISSHGEQIMAFVDISSQKNTLSMLMQTNLLIGFCSLVVFFGISFCLARWAVKPVEKAWRQQKQFVSDASHELKTPLTVIMSNAELLQSPDCSEENREQFADSILTMSRRMRNLVEGLLELARADNGQVKKNFAPVDMSTLTEEALLPFEPMYFERGLLLEGVIEPGIRLMGNEQYLRQTVDILLDNAMKYSAPGVVSVYLRRQGRNCLLMVSNPGEPIPREDLQRIFERFYRSDQARTGNGSFGLGLSIAKSVTQEHGGRIWAESNATGNCFIVQLPVG